MRLWANPRDRIDFFVRHGVVPRQPTPAQLERASWLIRLDAGITDRIPYYLRHPRDIFVSKRKAAGVRMSNAQIRQGGLMTDNPERVPTRDDATSYDGLDRALRYWLLMSPLRFALQTAINPYNLVPGTGLTIPTRFLIEHILHTPHPQPLWDIQVVQADDGGLDRLEEAVRWTSQGKSVRARINRALAQRDGYYDDVLDVIAGARRFEYPTMPPDRDPKRNDLVAWLNYALTL
jgi:hypothetical protein